jgi:hypothetical protein
MDAVETHCNDVACALNNLLKQTTRVHVLWFIKPGGRRAQRLHMELAKKLLKKKKLTVK